MFVKPSASSKRNAPKATPRVQHRRLLGAPLVEEEPSEDSGSLSLDAAQKMALDALEESRRARREADRMQARVDEYNRQVKASRRQFQGAAESLQEAQQQVLNSVPRPRFTSAYAPASGTVVWISRLAREVGRGDAVFGLSRGQR
jgi:hypothetical protein